MIFRCKVAIEWAGIMIVDVYVSPNSGWTAFEEFLDGVGHYHYDYDI